MVELTSSFMTLLNSLGPREMTGFSNVPAWTRSGRRSAAERRRDSMSELFRCWWLRGKRRKEGAPLKRGISIQPHRPRLPSPTPTLYGFHNMNGSSALPPLPTSNPTTSSHVSLLRSLSSQSDNESSVASSSSRPPPPPPSLPLQPTTASSTSSNSFLRAGPPQPILVDITSSQAGSHEGSFRQAGLSSLGGLGIDVQNPSELVSFPLSFPFFGARYTQSWAGLDQGFPWVSSRAPRAP